MVDLLTDPRRRLSIEVLPERSGARPPEAAARPAWATGAAAMAAIAGLHALAIGWVLYGANLTAKRSEPPPLVLITLQETAGVAPQFPRPLALTGPALATIPDFLPRSALPRPVLAAPASDPIEAAPSANSGQIVRVCGAVLRQQSADKSAASTRSLLLRVETNGRVTDSRSENEQDSVAIDDAARDCIMAHVILAPTRIDGAPVASWQRVVWSIAPAVRGR
jgi:hypothetical protein